VRRGRGRTRGLLVRRAGAGDGAHAIVAADEVVKAREPRAQATRDAAALRAPRTRERLAPDEASLEMLAAHATNAPFLSRCASSSGRCATSRPGDDPE
jgi:hypothetical protein